MSGILGMILALFAVHMLFRESKIEKLLTIVAVALLITTMDFYLPQETVRIEAVREGNAESKGTEIEIRRIYADGKEIPFTSIFQGNVWEVTNAGGFVWRAYEDSAPVIEGTVCNISDIRFDFICYQWNGIVKVTVGNETTEIDCYSEEYTQESISMMCEGSVEGVELLKLRTQVFVISFLVLLLLTVLANILVKKRTNEEIVPLSDNRTMKKSLDKLLVIYALIVFGMSASRFQGWVGMGLDNINYGFLVLTLVSGAIIGYYCLKVGKDDAMQSGRKQIFVKLVGILLGCGAINLILNLKVFWGNGSLQAKLQQAFQLRQEDSLLLPIGFAISGAVYILVLFVLKIIKKNEPNTIARLAKIFWLVSWWGFGLVLIAFGVEISGWISLFFILVVCGLLLRGYASEGMSKEKDFKWFIVILMLASAIGITMVMTLASSALRGAAVKGYLFIGPAIAIAGLALFYKSQDTIDMDWLFDESGKQKVIALADLSATAYFIHIYLKEYHVINIGYDRIGINGDSVANILVSAIVYYIVALVIAYIVHRLPFVILLKRKIGERLERNGTKLEARDKNDEKKDL